MTTNDSTLDDAKLAEIKAAAIEANTGGWKKFAADDGAWVEDRDSVVADGISDAHATHIVATQPRVALAMVAEIRRLRDIIETIRALRGEGAK